MSISYTGLNTTQLIPHLFGQSDPRAWNEFFSRYHPRMVEWASRSLQNDDALEVASEVLAKLVERLIAEKFVPICSGFRPWIHRVVQNTIIDRCRRDRRLRVNRVEVEEQLATILDPQALDDLAGEIDSQLHEDLRRAEQVCEIVRTKVKAHNWIAFERTVLGNEDPAEVALALGIGLASVYKARKRVAEALREVGQALFVQTTP